MKIICLVGMPGSGKSLVRRIIRRNFKVHTIASGDIVRKELRKRKEELTPKTDIKIGEWFHKKGRESLIAERTWQRIKRHKNNLVVIDGFRSPNDVRYLTKFSGVKPTIIAITAPFEIRAKREIKRKRMKGKESVSYIKARDKSELKRGLGTLIRNADYTVDNSRLSKKQLENRIIALVKKI